MRVVIEHHPATRRVSVYVLQDTPAIMLARVGDEWVAVPEGEEPPKFLYIEEELFAALVEQGQSIVPASSVMEEALKDTRVVRDRMIALVERLSE